MNTLRKLFYLILLISLPVYADNISDTITTVVSDDSTTVFNANDIEFSPGGGVEDKGDGFVKVNLDTALNGTFKTRSNANIPTANWTGWTTGISTSGDIDGTNITATTLLTDTINSIDNTSVFDLSNAGGGTVTLETGLNLDTSGTVTADQLNADTYYDANGDAQWGSTNGTGDFAFDNKVAIGGAVGDPDLLVTQGGTQPSWLGATIFGLVGTGGASSNAQMSIISGNTGTARIFLGDNNEETRAGLKYDNDAETLTIEANNIDALVIDSSGNLAIGATTPIAAQANIISDNNALADVGTDDNYHMIMRNMQNDTNEGVGLAFAISAGEGNVGAAIIHKRTNSAGMGELQFYTKQTTSNNADPTLAYVIEDDGDHNFQGGSVTTTNGGTFGNRNSTTWRFLVTEPGVNAEDSPVFGNDDLKSRALAVMGDGAAYIVGRDVTNDIEFAMGVSATGVAFVGAMTAHDLSLRTGNTSHWTVDDTNGNFISGTDGTAANSIITIGDIVINEDNNVANLILGDSGTGTVSIGASTADANTDNVDFVTTKIGLGARFISNDTTLRFVADGNIDGKGFFQAGITGGSNSGSMEFTGINGADLTSLNLLSPLVTFSADTEIDFTAGRVHLGDVGLNDYAGFSHIDKAAITTYALLQAPDGKTFLNTVTGNIISFRVNNVEEMFMSATVLDAGSLNVTTAGTLQSGNAYLTEGVRHNVTAVTTTTYTTLQTDYFHDISTTTAGADVTITVPDASDSGDGKVFVYKDVDDDNNVILDPAGGDTIDGDATLTFKGQGAVSVYSDGTSDWRIF